MQYYSTSRFEKDLSLNKWKENYRNCEILQRVTNITYTHIIKMMEKNSRNVVIFPLVGQ